MKEAVSIKIKASHRVDGNEDVLEYEYEGKFRSTDHSVVFMYESYADEENKADIDKNIITVKDGLVEHTKRGAINTRFVFRKNECTKVAYSTAYGGYNMDLYTHDIQVKRLEDEMKLFIRYDLLEGIEPGVAPCLNKIISSVDLEILISSK